MVVAVNPALIMVLVGSLVYFLLEMFYQGQYPQRLHFCLTMFVFGAVLIARISMEEGWERAAPFGAALALVVALALNKFVTYTSGVTEGIGWIINLSLMAITWWCADRLTWDCTLVDESQDASGEGLLQTVGIDRQADAEEQQPASAEPSPRGEGEKLDDDDLGWAVKPGPKDGGQSWWQRFVNRRRRPHSPGVWVVYFSLAALPIFGFGQTLIPESNTASRRYAFLLLCVYLASALGLLLTTSFLGLRRYLRQRRIEMPLTMANTWLAIGGVLIVSLLFLTAVLPRPNAEYAISELPLAVNSTDQTASQHSAGEEGTKDEQADTGGGKSNDGKTNTANSADGKIEGENGKGGESNKPNSKGGEGSSSKDAKAGASQKDSGNQSQKGQDRDSSSSNSSKPPPADSGQNSSPPSDASSSPSPPDLSVVTKTMMSLGKWIFYGVLIGLALWWLVANWSNLPVWLSSLINAWRDFWGSLFGKRRQTEDGSASPAAPKKSFLEFSDPFASGVYGQYPPAELVRYTFEAFEAWARDNGWPREPDQTAYEFARQVATHAEHLAAPGRTLADLYSRVAYSPSSLPTATVDQLRTFWQALAQRGTVMPADAHTR